MSRAWRNGVRHTSGLSGRPCAMSIRMQNACRSSPVAYGVPFGCPTHSETNGGSIAKWRQPC